MKPTTFWSAESSDAERAFRDWQWDHPDGFYINEKTKNSGMIHRVDCFHVGAPGNNDPSYHVTVSPKHCHASSRALREWARRKGMRLEDCSTCNPPR